MKKYNLRLILLMFTATFCFVSSVFADTSSTSIKPPFGIRYFDVGVAPDFTLQDIDGENFALKSTRGKWVFLHFWASWCGPCRKEMPVIQQLANNLQHKNFQIVMVNTAEDEDTIFEFLGKIGVELNSLMDKDGQVTEVWKPRGLPTTFLINPKGEVKYQAIGGRDWNRPEYIEFLKKLLSSADKSK